MRLQPYTPSAIGLCLALALSVPAGARAQVDTTRRDTSDMRIPIRKDRGMAMDRTSGTSTQRESGGDVATATSMRIDSLEAVTREYRTRLDSLEAANSAAASRTAALEARINALADSLATARTELSALREELNAANTRITEVDTRVQNLTQRFNSWRDRSLFGNSGFYIGLGGGSNYTTGTLREIGYEAAPLITVPIGWHKRGSMLGIRTEWSSQRLEGVQTGSFFNPDPTIFSGTAMLTVAFPINHAKSNNLYLMGGGGFYTFRNFGTSSGLAETFSGSVDDANTETKWGFTGGAGLEVHILGATSLFVQSAITNVAANSATAGESGRNLRWMPVQFGFLLR